MHVCRSFEEGKAEKFFGVGKGEKIKMDVNHQDQGGCTRLYRAVGRGNLPLMKDLLKKGADVNIKNLHGNSPLLFATGRGFQNIALLLIEKGMESMYLYIYRFLCINMFSFTCS
jgi:ankyrin repeat protein